MFVARCSLLVVGVLFVVCFLSFGYCLMSLLFLLCAVVHGCCLLFVACGWLFGGLCLLFVVVVFLGALSVACCCESFVGSWLFSSFSVRCLQFADC